MKLINTPTFNGYPIINNHGPLIENILNRNQLVLEKATASHRRTTMLRFELKFPNGYSGSVDVISRFFDSLRYKLNNDLVKKTISRERAIKSDIHYIWVKETSALFGWHYHLALFLNYDVYNCFGSIDSSNVNMFNRISSSWSSALGLGSAATRGMVHIPDNPVYKLERASMSFYGDYCSVLYRLSYFAKIKTKPYGGDCRIRFYGTSKL